MKQAIEKKMETFALTEHMPREEEDFYPEEVNTLSGPYSKAALGLLTPFKRSNSLPTFLNSVHVWQHGLY